MRSDFSSSRLVRLLGEWAPAATQPPSGDFAERLGGWLNAFDAIGLQAAHPSIRAIDTVAPGKLKGGRPANLAHDVQHARAALTKAIAQDPELLPDAGFASYRRRHLELQRQMDQMISALRDHVRQVISTQSPNLRQLATLDAVLEQALAKREAAVWPIAASLMERRYKQVRDLSDEGSVDAFEKDWRDAVLAELDLRLEPVMGLVEASANESKNFQ